MPQKPLKPKGASTPRPNDPNRFKTPAQREAERQAKAYTGKAQQEYENRELSLSDEKRLRDANTRNQQQPTNRYVPANQHWEDSQNNAILKQNAAAPVNNNPASPGTPSGSGSRGGSPYGSSGGGGAAAAPQMTLEEQLAAIQGMTGEIDPTLRALVPTSGEIELMYKRLTDSFAQNQANLKKDYDAAIAAVTGNYNNSNQYIQNAISGDQSTLAQAAANLGIDPAQWASGSTAQSQNEILNRLLGVGSQNQATDLAWFEKMKNLDASQFTDMSEFAAFQKQGVLDDSSKRLQTLQEMANEAARNQAMAALIPPGFGSSGGSGGGGSRGGRRGFGGGGGKSSAAGIYKTLSETATETGKLDFAGLANEISQLPADMQAIAWDYWVEGGASGEGAAKVLLRDRKAGVNPLGGDQATLDYLYQIMLGYTPGVKPINTQTVQDKSTQSTKVYGVPPITQGPAARTLPPPTGRNSSLGNIGARAKAAAGAKTPPKSKGLSPSAKKALSKLF